MSTSTSVSFQINNVPTVDGQLDLRNIEDQLSQDPAWTALSTQVKQSTLTALQGRVAEAILERYLPKQEDVAIPKQKRNRRKKSQSQEVEVQVADESDGK